MPRRRLSQHFKPTPFQKKAMVHFDSFGYVVVEGPRVIGKTAMLEMLANAKKSKRKIWLSRWPEEHKRKFGYIENLVFVKYDDNLGIESLTSHKAFAHCQIVLADDIHIKPPLSNESGFVKIASVYTEDHNVVSWREEDNPWLIDGRFERMANTMTNWQLIADYGTKKCVEFRKNMQTAIQQDEDMEIDFGDAEQANTKTDIVRFLDLD